MCVSLCVLQEFREKDTEVWKISKVQFVYDTSETSHFINAYNRESPAGRACVCVQWLHSAHFHPSFISRLRSARRIKERIYHLSPTCVEKALTGIITDLRLSELQLEDAPINIQIVL